MLLMFLIGHTLQTFFIFIDFFWIIFLEMQCQNLASFPANDLLELSWSEIFLHIHVYTSLLDAFHFLEQHDFSDSCSACHPLYPQETFPQIFHLENHKHFIRTCDLSCSTERQCNPDPCSLQKPVCKNSKSIVMILPLLYLLSLKAPWTEGHHVLQLQMDFSTAIYPSLLELICSFSFHSILWQWGPQSSYLLH